jgi:hypothetical protein
MIRLIESDHDLISLFGHDLRADAARLSRGRAGLHFSGSCPGAFSSEVGTGSREEHAPKQESGASVLIQSEPKNASGGTEPVHRFAAIADEF